MGTRETNIELLEAFMLFLTKEGYCDIDAYVEPPTAMDQFMKEKPEYFPLISLDYSTKVKSLILDKYGSYIVSHLRESLIQDLLNINS